jgi:hypothetical protein
MGQPRDDQTEAVYEAVVHWADMILVSTPKSARGGRKAHHLAAEEIGVDTGETELHPV